MWKQLKGFWKKSSWQELVQNEIWLNEHFLPKQDLQRIYSFVARKQSKELDGRRIGHLISPTYFNYNQHQFTDSEALEFKGPILDRLNCLLSAVYRPLDFDKINELKFVGKSFTVDKSYYALHAEPERLFGAFAFVFFLSEVKKGGELLFPSEQSHCGFLSNESEVENWQMTIETFKRQGDLMRYLNDVVISPKVNRCVVFRTGSAHLVRPVEKLKCGGDLGRYTLTGWPYITDAWKGVKRVES